MAAAVNVVPRSTPSAYIDIAPMVDGGRASSGPPELGEHAFARADRDPRRDRELVAGQRVLRAALPSGEGFGRGGGELGSTRLRVEPQAYVHGATRTADQVFQVGHDLRLATDPAGPDRGEHAPLEEQRAEDVLQMSQSTVVGQVPG